MPPATALAHAVAAGSAVLDSVADDLLDPTRARELAATVTVMDME
jgi:hypothetical protein